MPVERRDPTCKRKRFNQMGASRLTVKSYTEEEIREIQRAMKNQKGQPRSIVGTSVDENGKPMLFNSMVDAMNFMAGLGWKFEAAYVISMPNPMGGAQHVYHWLLSKDITAGDNAVEGLKTQGQYKQENPAN